MPVSCTEIWMNSGFFPISLGTERRAALNVTVPPAGVNFTALLARLYRICLSLRSSPQIDMSASCSRTVFRVIHMADLSFTQERI